MLRVIGPLFVMSFLSLFPIIVVHLPPRNVTFLISLYSHLPDYHSIKILIRANICFGLFNSDAKEN